MKRSQSGSQKPCFVLDLVMSIVFVALTWLLRCQWLPLPHESGQSHCSIKREEMTIPTVSVLTDCENVEAGQVGELTCAPRKFRVRHGEVGRLAFSVCFNGRQGSSLVRDVG